MNLLSRPRPEAVALVSILALTSGGLPLACGGGGSGGPGSSDAGSESDAGMMGEVGGPADGPRSDAPEAGISDGGEGGTVDGPVPEGGDAGSPLAAGSLLAAGPALSAWVVTSDGFVAYADESTGTASAVSLTGGAPEQIAAGKPGAVAIARLASNLFATGDPGAVAVLTDTATVDGGIGNLAFTTWRSTSGAQPWWGPGTLTYDLAGARDGSHVSWFELDSTGTTGSLYVSSSGLQQAYTVASGLALAPHPPLAFGGVSGTDLIVLLPNGTLEAYDTTAGTAKTISNNVLPCQLGQFVLDPTGTHVAFLDGAGSLYVATAPAYAPVLVSSAPNLQSFPAFSPDGATLYFYDTAGTVYRSPVAAPSATNVTTGAAQGIDAVSPDGNWLLTSNTYANNGYPAG